MSGGGARDRLYRLSAVVLGRRDLGEADRILTLYAPGHGKVRAVAKGIRKIASRKAGHLELFNHCNLLLAKGRNLDIITQADTLRAFPGLRDDLDRAGQAYYLAELVDRFSQENEGQAPLFDLLLDTLAEVEAGPAPELAVRYFELHLLALSGYRPEFFVCTVCGLPLEERDALYSLADGGVVCHRCPQPHEFTRPVSASAIKLVRFLQQRPWSEVARLKFRAPLQRELELLLHATLAYILERDLKSRGFLDRLRRESAAS